MWTKPLRASAVAVAVAAFASSALTETVPSFSLDYAKEKPGEKKGTPA